MDIDDTEGEIVHILDSDSVVLASGQLQLLGQKETRTYRVEDSMGWAEFPPSAIVEISERGACIKINIQLQPN